MIRYVFRDDEPLTIKAAKRASAQKIGEALADISAAHDGHLHPRDVVAAARDRKSPLNRHFEWNDAKAAEQFRLSQARSLIRSIRVETDATESGTARAFLSIRDGGKVAYRTLDTVMNSADLQAKVLASAEKDLIAFETRFRSLTDICDLVRQARERIASRRSAGKDSRISAS